jgi:ketol-acid reductoisomerase
VAYGLQPESAYYESLHETPLIANTIARKKLFEMNRVISDTAEYGCYLYSQACEPLLKDFMAKQDIDVIGTKYNKSGSNQVTDSIAQSTTHVPPTPSSASYGSLICARTHVMTTPC